MQPDPGPAKQERDEAAGNREHDDGHRDAEDVALTQKLKTVHAGAPLHDVELEQHGLPEAGATDRWRGS